MRRAFIRTHTYVTGREDFLVDVVTTRVDGVEIYEAWLYRKSRGAKLRCFHDEGTIPREEFMECIECLPDVFYESYDEVLEEWDGDNEEMREVTWI